MCGICGASWTNDAPPRTPGELAAMMGRIVHRGPDDSGTYFDDHAALGFRRLAIVDLAGGHQPLSNEDGSVWVVFNGEIYNFPALRRRLEARGHVLRSAGDTEVLVHLYEDEGPDFPALLRGMFALAIWDTHRRTLVLARDRMGQKPLIYRREPGRITFASELKALLALPDTPRILDPAALDLYLTYGYIGHPRTILQGVHKLPPAHLAIWHAGELSLRRYWNPDWTRERVRPISEDVEELRETLEQATREQMVADVPIGAFLSGGIDSTIVTGLMQRASNRPVYTFAVGFPDPAFDETAFAEMAASHLGTEHHKFRVEPRAWDDLPALADQFDEPFADSSALPTWYVSRETRKHVTVALTGDAGDELFGGYDRYRALAIVSELERRLPKSIRSLVGGPLAQALPASARAKTRLRAIRRLLEGVSRPFESRYLGWVQLFGEEARGVLYDDDWMANLPGDDPTDWLAQALNVAPLRDPASRAMIADLLTYLPGDLLVKVDLASMAHSLECRAPFLDHRVVELALAMPVDRKVRLRTGHSKAVLKEAFGDLLPVPIRNRPKMGFGVPIDRWFRGELNEPLHEILLDPVSLDRGVFQPSAVRAMLNQHTSGTHDHAYRLWALMMLELWFRHHFDRPPIPTETVTAENGIGFPVRNRSNSIDPTPQSPPGIVGDSNSSLDIEIR